MYRTRRSRAMLKPGEPDVYLPSSCRPNRFLRTTHDVHYGRRALRWHKPLALARSLCGNGRVATLLAQLGMTRTRKIERLAVEYNLTEHCNLACHGCGRASRGTSRTNVRWRAVPSASGSVMFAYFVLELCVYPAKALERMVSLVCPAESSS